MSSARKYKFHLKEAVSIPRGRAGIIIDRRPDHDHVQTVQCRNTDAGAQQFADGSFYRSIAHHVNAYRVEYVGDDGRPATDWWHEEMLAPVKP